jgi:HSP20 family molecular chaperone IbpA
MRRSSRFVVKADVPGTEVKDLEMQREQDHLKVSGHREDEKSEEGARFASELDSARCLHLD